MSIAENNNEELHHIVILGGGFGGLYAAKKLSGKKVKVTVVDKRNFHLFQPSFISGCCRLAIAG